MQLFSRVRAVQLPAARASRHAARLSQLHAHRAFHSLGLHAELVHRLAEHGMTQPTAAQEQAIPAILRGSDVVIAAETGGGKTLAYLLPLLEQLQTHPLGLRDTHRPVGLILTTSQELVRQVTSVLATLAPELAKHVVSLSSTNQSLSGHRTCPIVIATPKALLRACKPKDFAFTRTVVVDEADMLLGGGFERDTKQIIATIRNQPLLLSHLNNFAHARAKTSASANASEASDDDDDDDVIDRSEIAIGEQRQTIFNYGKRSVRQYIEYKFPSAHFAVTDDFQRTLPRLDMTFHELRDDEYADPDSIETDAARQALVWQILTDPRHAPAHTLVFANSVASADALFAFLEQQVSEAHGNSAHAFPLRVLLFHKEVDRPQRARVLAELADANAPPTVVVCTDIAARGLDTTRVRHVVQYEFATDVVSHLHRIGRTARAGTAGRVSNIVSKANALVLGKIRAAGAAPLDGAFSRKRSLRKKAKKQQQQR